MTDTAALLGRIEQLERRAQAAEDYRDLVNLQGAYGYYVDKGLWDEAADLFAKDGTLEAWARSSGNPVGGWYGLRKGYRGRFAMYVPPLLEHLGLVELEHNPRNNRLRAR